MDRIFMEIQNHINDCNNLQHKILMEQIEILLKIIEDHEKDMIKMANKINELERKLSENKGD